MERGPNLVAVVPGSFVSGAELLLLRDLAAARRAGWQVRVACSDGPLVDRLAAEAVDRVAIADLRLGDGARTVAGARLGLATVRAARVLRRTVANRDEVLLVNGVNALPAATFARRGRPVVLFAHDVLVRGDRLALARTFRRSVRGAIAVSDATAAPLRAMGLRTVVARQGTESPVDPAVAGGAPRIGIVAALTPWKGHRVLLDALARLEHRDVTLEILGAAPPKDTAYAEELRQQVRDLGLDGRVEFLGFVDDPLARMRSWTTAVVASTDPEAGPLVALEAMSIGVPVVATNHGGVCEVLGDAGVLVPPNDAGAIARAIDRLLADGDLAARCRAAGPRRIVDEHLTRADHEQRFLAALDELVAR